MRTLLAVLSILASTAALAAEPQCSAVPDGCALGATTCTYDRMCVDAKACTVRQTIYVQDCTFDPRPRYCPPGNATAPATIVRQRKINCPNPLDLD